MTLEPEPWPDPSLDPPPPRAVIDQHAHDRLRAAAMAAVDYPRRNAHLPPRGLDFDPRTGERRPDDCPLCQDPDSMAEPCESCLDDVLVTRV